MFSVHGVSGKIYSGTLEQVRDLAPVQATARARASEAAGGAESRSFAHVLAGQGGGAGAGQTDAPQNHLAFEALAAYGGGAPARRPLMLVHELMSRHLISVPVRATLRQAWAVLADAGVGQAPVLNAASAVVGLISRADLLRNLPRDLERAGDFATRLDASVSVAMWSPVPVARQDTPVRAAAQLMLELGLPGLPVADDADQLVGFLSRTDLLKALTREPPLDLWS